jgi:hypothetical protein
VIFGEEKIRSVIGNLAENPSPVMQFDAVHGVGRYPRTGIENLNNDPRISKGLPSLGQRLSMDHLLHL